MVGLSSKLDSSGSVLLDGLEPSKLQLGSGTGLGKAGGLPEVVAHMGSLEGHTEPLLLLHGSGVGLGQAVVSIVGMFSKVDSNGCVLFESLHPAEPLLGSGTGLNQAEVFVEIPAHLGSPEGHTEPLLLLHGSGAGLGQAHVGFDGVASKFSSGGSVFAEKGSPELFLRCGAGLGQAHVSFDGVASKSSSGRSVLFEEGSPELRVCDGVGLGQAHVGADGFASKSSSGRSVLFEEGSPELSVGTGAKVGLGPGLGTGLGLVGKCSGSDGSDDERSHSRCLFLLIPC